jgi:hypothetical protein
LTLLFVVLLAPLLFMLVAVYAVIKLAALMLRVIFAPVVWMSRQETRRRVELRHYRGD